MQSLEGRGAACQSVNDLTAACGVRWCSFLRICRARHGWDGYDTGVRAMFASFRSGRRMHGGTGWKVDAEKHKCR